MIARSGTYSVRSRVVDDDGGVYSGTMVSLSEREPVETDLFVDFEWSFKLAKEW